MLFAFLRHVDRRRFRPVVVFFQPGPFRDELERMGFHTEVIPTRRLRNLGHGLAAVRLLSALFQVERPALVLNWMAKAHLYGGTAAAITRSGPRTLWWQHEVPGRHWIDRAAAMVPAVAVGCSSEASAAAQRRQRPRRPTFVVHPGIDEPVHLPEAERRELRRQCGIDDGATVVATAGRLQPTKGQHRVIDLVARLRQRGQRVHGLIIGGAAHGLSPGYPRELHQLVVERGLSAVMTFTGHVPNASRYIQLADVLVHAADREPFGIVLLEGMALGIPVVSFDTAGPSEIVEHGRSGILVPAGDDDALAAAVEHVLTDGEARGRLVGSGQERFRARFTADRMTKQLEAHFEALAQGRAA